MPLSFEVRRKDKNKLYPDRVPKLYLTQELANDLAKRYSNIVIREFRGKKYVDIRDFKTLSWVKYEREKSTRDMFAFSILKFCRYKNAFPDDLIKIYSKDINEAITDIKNYINYLLSEGYSSHHIDNILVSIVTWLNVNGIMISRDILRKRYRVKIPPKSEIPDMPPTREELKKILMSASIKWRAIFSFLSASGMRPSEALIIRIGDLEPHPYDVEDSVVKIRVPSTITKKDFGYVTFIHPECVRFIVDYLRFLESKGYDVEDPNFILLFNTYSKDGFYKVNSVEVAWNKILRKLNLDQRIEYSKRKVYVRRLYTLRKFFRTNLEAAGVPHGAVEAMLGHKAWYVRFSEEQLKKYYIKGMWALMVFRSNIDEGAVKQIVETHIKPLQKELEKMKREREMKFISQEKELREIIDKFYKLLLRHPELLKELKES